MSSKLITALIILTVAALGTAAAFQYLEMESFGLPKTLQERFFPEKAPAPEANSTANSENTGNTENSADKQAEAAPANQE